MTIKNLFGRGIGFNDGQIGYVVTRGYGALDGAPPDPGPTGDKEYTTLKPILQEILRLSTAALGQMK